MAEHDAFTAGVKPGGLTNSHDIRLLLCYVVRYAGPLTKQDIVTALVAAQLVNYFEIADRLEDIVKRGLARVEGEAYSITEKGKKVADELELELPRSVRESAIEAVVRAQVWHQKSAEYDARVQAKQGGYSICCTIRGMDREDFTLQLMMPDRLTAELVKKRFILRGNEIYELLLSKLTDPEPTPKK